MTRYASIIRKGRDLTQVAFNRILGKAKPTTEKDLDVLIHVAGYQLPKAQQILSGASPGYRSLLRKGDFEGHPFRGNQYTGGGGASVEELDTFLKTIPVKENPRLGNEATTLSGRHVEVGPKFKGLDKEQQRHVLIHEAAHFNELDMWYLKNKDDWDLAEKFPHGSLNGQTTPGEIVAEAYGLAWTEPEFLERVGPFMFPILAEGIKAQKLPMPPAVAKHMAKKGDYEGHPFRGNQWTSGTGGGGGEDKEEPVGKVNPGRFVFPDEIEEWNEAEFKAKIGNAATAQEIFGTFAGDDFDAKEWSVVTKIENGKKYWGVQGHNTKIHGTEVNWISRYFDMAEKDVYHDYLRFKLNNAGGATAARLLGDSLALYDKMGLKTITTQASLEMGAYTWAKYGFAYKSDEDREVHIEGRPGVVPGVRENMQNLIRSTAGVQNLTSEQKREIKMIGDLLSTKDLRVNQMLVDLKTPALDELVSGVTQEYLQENSSFMKHVFYNTDYKARISLDKNSPDRKRMEAYIRARKSAPPKPGARKFDEAVKLGYTVVMKSKQQPTVGGDFHCLKNGTPSNGAVMNYLLGDEPDVAETSAELAKKLGLPEDLIKALGGK